MGADEIRGRAQARVDAVEQAAAVIRGAVVSVTIGGVPIVPFSHLKYDGGPVILVGEANPYGGDPGYALWPEPRGASGDRLCRVILGMDHGEYFRTFQRVNLCPRAWSRPVARSMAEQLVAGGARLVLLGSKVCSAFGVPSQPFTRSGPDGRWLLLPHPSGLCRVWNEPGAFARARAMVLDLVGRVGKADRGGE